MIWGPQPTQSYLGLSGGAEGGGWGGGGGGGGGLKGGDLLSHIYSSFWDPHE